MDREMMDKINEIFEKTTSRCELIMNDLDGISGGQITKNAAEAFDGLIISLKYYNYTIEDCIDFVQNTLSFDNPLFEETTRSEAVAYIEARWDIL